MKTLTQHQLVITSLALKRYAFSRRQPAAHLGVLVPGYLSSLPTYFMDDQPLRYRMNPNVPFVRYSVGASLQDGAGDFVAEAPNGRRQDPSPWNGRDRVWPESGAGAKNPQFPSVRFHNRSE